MQSETVKEKATRPLLCPFTIIVDTREQRPYKFAGIVGDVKDGGRLVSVPLHGDCIPAGDYSIQGWTDKVAVERKSKADLYSTLGSGRARFGRELERLDSLWWAAVVVEADWRELLQEPPPYSRLLPKTVYRSVVAWQMRFPSVHWWMCPGREFAERTTFRLLERFWKEIQR